MSNHNEPRYQIRTARNEVLPAISLDELKKWVREGRVSAEGDRITALLFGADSIRDVIAFPKSGGGVDPLTDAPAPITAQQRKESGMDHDATAGKAAGKPQD